MIVTLDRRRIPTPLERELILSATHVKYDGKTINIEVDEFVDFLHILMHAWHVLSMVSEPEAMRTEVHFSVSGRDGFARVENGGIRYGGL